MSGDKEQLELRPKIGIKAIIVENLDEERVKEQAIYRMDAGAYDPFDDGGERTVEKGF